MAYRKHITKEQALQKLKQYCAFQERCHSEVKMKLYALGMNKMHADAITTTLIEENYLNEERYAIAFAGGHFRIKQWGKSKIMHALKQKQVSPYCIAKALKQIDELDYKNTLFRLAEKKWHLLKAEENNFIRIAKVTDYLLQKGFEQNLIQNAMKTIKSS